MALLKTKRCTVLIADDEVMIRELLTRLLNTQGVVVLCASDGQEALELSRHYAGTIDLVITDVDMPRLTGLELWRHLVQERPGVKGIVMSGAADNDPVHGASSVPFLPKPFDTETLLSTVRAVLASSAQPAG